MVVTRIGRLQRLPPLLIGLLILMAIGLLPVSLPTEDDTNTLAIPQGNGVTAKPIGAIFTGITVAQEFPVTGTAISAVALVLTTYERVNSGTIQVILQTPVNGQWQPLGSRTMQKANLQDNALNTVTFDPPLVVKPGQIVGIVVQSDGDDSNAISWWMNALDQRPGFALFLNGDPLPGTAQFQISYARASGRLVGMIGPVWTRATIFLDPLWRVVLVVGILVLFSGFFMLGRNLPGEAPALAEPLAPRPVRAIEEEICSPSPSLVEEEGTERDEGAAHGTHTA